MKGAHAKPVVGGESGEQSGAQVLFARGGENEFVKAGGVGFACFCNKERRFDLGEHGGQRDQDVA